MTAPWDFGLDFKAAPERLEAEAGERAALLARRIHTNVDFLDHMLGGILPHDLVLLGARTGAGKTALASMIAESCSRTGRRVHYFALEAEPSEIERRIKFRAFARRVVERLPHEAHRLDYADWYSGDLEDVFTRVERDIRDDLVLPNLFTYYRGTEFTADSMDRLFRAVQDQTDLIILDHLHYVDIADDVSENRAVKDVVKRIRDVALSIGKPVLVIAHLRKRDRNSQSLVPDLDDFHGTSDITKIATKVVLIGPATDRPRPPGRPWAFPTYVHVPKDRMRGRSGIGAVLSFDARTGAYEPGYEVGRFNADCTKWEKLGEREIPLWLARRMSRSAMRSSSRREHFAGEPIVRLSDLQRSPGEDDE